MELSGRALRGLAGGEQGVIKGQATGARRAAGGIRDGEREATDKVTDAAGGLRGAGISSAGSAASGPWSLPSVAGLIDSAGPGRAIPVTGLAGQRFGLYEVGAVEARSSGKVPRGVAVTGTVLRDDRAAGEFRFHYYRDADGRLVADHDVLRLHDTADIDGAHVLDFRKDFFATTERWYRDSGVHQIKTAGDSRFNHQLAEDGYGWDTSKGDGKFDPMRNVVQTVDTMVLPENRTRFEDGSGLLTHREVTVLNDLKSSAASHLNDPPGDPYMPTPQDIIRQLEVVPGLAEKVMANLPTTWWVKVL